MLSKKPNLSEKTISGIKPVKVIAVTAGKGGVGKTNVSVNLAIALAKLKQKVMLLDADLGLANVDVLLGLSPKKNLYHVLHNECDLQDVIVQGPAGIQIIPSASGIEIMTQLSRAENAGIINAFNELSEDLNVLIIDTAAGISDSVVNFICSAQEVVIVVCDEPTSITDAYAMIKILNRHHQVGKFHVLANMVSNQGEGRALFNKLNRVTEQFLSVNLQYMGAIPHDEHLRQAVKKQKAVLEMYPSSKASEQFRRIAEKMNAWPVQKELPGQSVFFIERLMQSA